MKPESRNPRLLKEAIDRAVHEVDSRNASLPTGSHKQMTTAAFNDSTRSTPLAADPLADKTPSAAQTPHTHDFAPLPPTVPGSYSASFGGFGGKPAPGWFRFEHPYPYPWLVEGPVRARRPRSRRKSRSLYLFGPNETARMPDACAIIGLSEGSIRNRYNPKSPYYDATFPPPKRLGGRGVSNSRNAIGWRAGDLYAWRDAQRSSKE